MDYVLILLLKNIKGWLYHYVTSVHNWKIVQKTNTIGYNSLIIILFYLYKLIIAICSLVHASILLLSLETCRGSDVIKAAPKKKSTTLFYLPRSPLLEKVLKFYLSWMCVSINAGHQYQWWDIIQKKHCVIVSGRIKGTTRVTNVMYPCGFICIPVVLTLHSMNLIIYLIIQF